MGKVHPKLSSNNENFEEKRDKGVVLNHHNKKVPTHAFQPGNTFGKGRPQGSKSKAQIALEAVGFEYAESVFMKTLQLALQGDLGAIKLILDRVYPVRKGTRLKLDLPPMTDIFSLNAAYTQVTDLLSKGDISAEEALGIAHVLELRRKTFETLDLKQQLDEVKEQLLALKKGFPESTNPIGAESPSGSALSLTFSYPQSSTKPK